MKIFIIFAAQSWIWPLQPTSPSLFDVLTWYSFSCKTLPKQGMAAENIVINITIFAVDLLKIKFFEQNKVYY